METQPASASDGVDPNRESIALCPVELWLPYSPCSCPHASRERGQLSSQSQRETLLGSSPEGPPALAGSRAIGWAALWSPACQSESAHHQAQQTPRLTSVSALVRFSEIVGWMLSGKALSRCLCHTVHGALYRSSVHSAPPTCQAPSYPCETAINIPTLRKRKWAQRDAWTNSCSCTSQDSIWGPLQVHSHLCGLVWPGLQ